MGTGFKLNIRQLLTRIYIVDLWTQEYFVCSIRVITYDHEFIEGADGHQ